MRNRLIELLNNIGMIHEREAETVADYLLENGVTVPPCKVGDTVYQTDGTRVYLSTINEIIYSKNNTIYATENIAFDERAIGKSIFLTIEEAEQALKEGVSDD